MKAVSRVAGATGLAIVLDLLIGMHLYGTDSNELFAEKRDYLIATMPVFMVLLNAIFHLMGRNGDLQMELQSAQSKKDVAVVLNPALDEYLAVMRGYQTKIMNGENSDKNIVALAKYIVTYLMNSPADVRVVVPFLAFIESKKIITLFNTKLYSLTSYLKSDAMGLEHQSGFAYEIRKRALEFMEMVEETEFRRSIKD
ncbi:MAG: hypothetical protein WC004_00600 [Candidatus Absconditabacterales bacterium]